MWVKSVAKRHGVLIMWQILAKICNSLYLNIQSTVFCRHISDETTQWPGATTGRGARVAIAAQITPDLSRQVVLTKARPQQFSIGVANRPHISIARYHVSLEHLANLDRRGRPWHPCFAVRTPPAITPVFFYEVKP